MRESICIVTFCFPVFDAIKVSFPHDQKSQKIIYFLRTQKSFKMKWKAFFIKQIVLEGESQTIRLAIKEGVEHSNAL